VSRKAFRLGGLFGGRLYFFTALGDHASHDAAVRRGFGWSVETIGVRLVTIETVPKMRNGIEYGHDYVVRDLAGALLNV
jgi:hypothetical protein